MPRTSALVPNVVIQASTDPSHPLNKLGDLGTPIGATSFFSIDNTCFGEKLDNKNFANGGEFFKDAYGDAIHIASGARNWPDLGDDAASLYFGRNIEEDRYKNDVVGNVSPVIF